MINDKTGKAIDYRFLEVNQVFERQTGLKNAAGKLGSEIASIAESYWLEGYDRVVQTGKPLRIENYNKDTKCWYSAFASRVGGVGSRQVAILFEDITDRKLREQQQKFLLKLSDALRSLSSHTHADINCIRCCVLFSGSRTVDSGRGGERT